MCFFLRDRLLSVWLESPTSARIDAVDDGLHRSNRGDVNERVCQRVAPVTIQVERDADAAVGRPDYATDVLDEYIHNHRKDVFDEDDSRPLLLSD